MRRIVFWIVAVFVVWYAASPFYGEKRAPQGITQLDASGTILEVNYDLPLKDAVRAGNYNLVDEVINEENFPKTQSGKKKLYCEFWVITHKDPMHREELEDFLRSQHLRPATLPELLAFGAYNPKYQRDYQTIALGSKDVLNKKVSNPYLGGSERSRWVKVFDERKIPQFFAIMGVREQ